MLLSKKNARNFFLGGTMVTFAVFLVMSFQTLTAEVPKRTHEENLSSQVISGKRIWEANNCMGCHTIMGEGGYYAPELTKVFERRGPEFIKAVLQTPAPWQPRGRKMVAYKMSDQEAADMIAFLKWVGEMDLNGFPPKPDYKATTHSNK